MTSCYCHAEEAPAVSSFLNQLVLSVHEIKCHFCHLFCFNHPMSALIRMDRNSEAKRAVVGTVSFFKEAKVWGRTQLVGEALLLKIKKEETTGKQRRTARQLQTAEGISGAEGQRARLPEKRRRD